MVDYLQLLSSGKHAENRVQELSEQTRSLKIMAKELNVPVLVLSQLSRLVESRDNKRPMLSDLRESGSIEQDADMVMFIYREIYYLKNNAPQQRDGESKEKFLDRQRLWEDKVNEVNNLAELIIAKQRHGPVGTIKLAFTPEFSRFTNYANQE